MQGNLQTIKASKRSESGLSGIRVRYCGWGGGLKMQDVKMHIMKLTYFSSYYLLLLFSLMLSFDPPPKKRLKHKINKDYISHNYMA